jgi:hypothetical protein
MHGFDGNLETRQGRRIFVEKAKKGVDLEANSLYIEACHP